MSKTEVKISSFAAPTDDDIALFEALSIEERRALIDAELEKGLAGEPVPLDDTLKDEISARVSERLK
ncbi:MAG: hypothetical protein AAF074_05275 [Pseudomonadota bacterium]